MATEREALENDGFFDVDLIFERLGIDGDAPEGTCSAQITAYKKLLEFLDVLKIEIEVQDDIDEMTIDPDIREIVDDFVKKYKGRNNET